MLFPLVGLHGQLAASSGWMRIKMGSDKRHEPVAPDRAIHADIVGHNYVTLISVSPKKDAANDGSPYFAYRGCAFVVTQKELPGEVTVNIRAIERLSVGALLLPLIGP